MMSLGAGFAEGSRTILPVVPGAATVALAAGLAAPAVGLTPLQSVAMSIVVYFPSVMLAVLDLIGAGVPEAVIVITSVVVGIRVVISSLSIAPYFKRFSTE